METDKRLDQIVQLLAKAESTTPEEAEAITFKVEQLMARYAIDDAMISAAAGKKSETDKPVVVNGTLDSIYSGAQLSLLHAITLQCNCRLIQTYQHNKVTKYAVAGFQSDVDRVQVLFASLLIQADRGARAEWSNTIKGYSGSTSSKLSYKVRRDFIRGFASGVGSKLHQANKLAAEAVAAERIEYVPASETTQSVALALRDRKAAVDDVVNEKFGRLTTGRARTVSAHGAYSNGRSAGRVADTGDPRLAGTRKGLNR